MFSEYYQTITRKYVDQTSAFIASINPSENNLTKRKNSVMDKLPTDLSETNQKGAESSNPLDYPKESFFVIITDPTTDFDAIQRLVKLLKEV